MSLELSEDLEELMQTTTSLPVSLVAHAPQDCDGMPWAYMKQRNYEATELIRGYLDCCGISYVQLEAAPAIGAELLTEMIRELADFSESYDLFAITLDAPEVGMMCKR